MKTVGLIGGMSWESTVTYYQVLNNTAKERLGGLHSARCIVYSVEFDEIERCQSAGEWDKAGQILQDAARRLELAGAELIILCTNTMHKVAGAIEAGITVPFLHIADATAAALHAHKVQRAILLGTRYTMEQDFIRGPLVESGLAVLVPADEERAEINRIIFEELCLGKIEAGSKRYLLGVIERLQQQGGDGVILGCTEIGLLVGQQDCAVPVVDTALVHARAAALWALE